jgi:hypothetical protein
MIQIAAKDQSCADGLGRMSESNVLEDGGY